MPRPNGNKVRKVAVSDRVAQAAGQFRYCIQYVAAPQTVPLPADRGTINEMRALSATIVTGEALAVLGQLPTAMA